MTTLQAAIDARGAAVGARQFEQSAGRIQRSARDIDGSVSRADRSVEGFGRSAVRSLGGIASAAAATAVAIQGIRVVAGFEEGLVTLGGVARATDEEFARLAATAENLGVTTRFSAREASDGLLFLARAGFSADEALASISDTLNLAATSGLQLGEAADVASNVLRQFSLDAAETGRVVDTLTNVANNANTDVRQLAQALVFAGPQAGAFGQSVEQTAASLGVLGDAGIQATLAGTNLRGIISTLIDPTRKGKEALDAMGVSLSDVNPAAVDLITIFSRLRDANLGAAEATQIFGRRNVGAALILSESADRIAELVGLQEDLRGETERLAALQNDTLMGSFRALRSAAEGYAISIGNAGAAGALKELVDFTTDVIRSLAGVDDSLVEISGGAQLAATGLRAATAAAIAFGAASVVTSIDLLAVSVLGVARAVRAVNVAVRANPIGLLAAAAAAAIAVFVDWGDEIDETAGSLDGLSASARRAEEATRALEGVVGRVASVRGSLLRAFDLGDSVQISAGLQRVRRELINASEVLREDPSVSINFADLLKTDVPALRDVIDRAMSQVDFEGIFASRLRGAEAAFSSANDRLTSLVKGLGLSVFDSREIQRAAAGNRELAEALDAQAVAASRLIALQRTGPTAFNVLSGLPSEQQIAVLEAAIEDLDRLSRVQVEVAETVAAAEKASGSFSGVLGLLTDVVDGARSAFNRFRTEQEIALIRSVQLTTEAIVNLEQENAILQLLIDGRRVDAELLRLRVQLQRQGVSLTVEAEERLRGLIEQNLSLNEALNTTGDRATRAARGFLSWERPLIDFEARLAEAIDPARQLERIAVEAPAALARGLEDAVFQAGSLNEILGETLLALSRIGFQTFVSGPLSAFLGSAIGGGGSYSGQFNRPGTLVGSFGSSGFTAAGYNGLMVDSGRREPFALGGALRGLLNSTVVFPMQNGRVGVAGEAGQEYAADPVRLPSGRLGVSVAGAGGGPTTINIYARDLDGVNRRAARQVARRLNSGVRG